jgi:hypothetical protein
MLKIEATPLAFDKTGLPLHKHDRVFVDWVQDPDDLTYGIGTTGENTAEAEIYDIVDPNQLIVICPFDSALYSVQAGDVEKQELTLAPVERFENTDPIENQNEGDQMGRARLMAPFNSRLDQGADILVALMRSVRKVVLPLQYKISRLGNAQVNEDGLVKNGMIGCEIQVSDYTMKRKGTVSIDLLVKDGEVQQPFFFRTSVGVHYPFTEAGFRKWLDIPATPYISKKTPSAELAFNRD